MVMHAMWECGKVSTLALWRRSGHNLCLSKLWWSLCAQPRSKHSSAKVKRAKFHNDESYRTHARRHHRRQDNERLKRQVEWNWRDDWDFWDTPKGAAKNRQAEHIADSFSDEQLWHWISLGNAAPKTTRQQRKAWRAWVKQCQEAANEAEGHQSADTHNAYGPGPNSQNARQADKQQNKQSSTFNWQQFEAFHNNMFRSWEFQFRSAFHDQQQGSRSEKQRERKSIHDLHKVQQQRCMQTLGLPRNSILDAAVLRSAFHDCAKKWHPDRHADSGKCAAESKFKEAQAAYQHLLTCL